MESIVFFSGAGMSAESGISTFRDSGGLWEKYKIEEVATPQAWASQPEVVQEFYNLRRANIREAKPNVAHQLIAHLERDHSVQVITQNIDDLHERAGSKNVLHLHGNIMLAKSSGPKCDAKFYPVSGDLDLNKDFCDDGFALRPHVVWFGEDVPMYDEALKVIQSAAVFVVIGTSLNVYPAAGLVHYAPKNCQCFIIDPHVDELRIPSNFIAIKKSATEGIKHLMENFLTKKG